MKKYVQNFWVRLLACLLCAVSVVGLVATGVGIVFFTTAGPQEEAYKNEQYVIAENYAAYIFENLDEEFIDGLDDFLAETNFDCAITKVESVSEEIENAEGGAVEETLENETVVEGTEETRSTLLYSSLENASEWDYQIEIQEYADVSYDIYSIWKALRISPVISEEEVLLSTPILNYVFDKNTGVFYYATSVGYFKADYVYVCEDGLSYDYKLTTVEGKECYYNGYYDLYLDTTKYLNWDWVQIGSGDYIVSELDPASIQIMKDSSVIENSLFNGEYIVDGDVICYYTTEKVDSYIIQINLKEAFETGKEVKNDLFAQWKDEVVRIYSLENDIPQYLISFVLLFILSFALLIYSAHGDKENISVWYRIPIFTFTACVVIVEFLLAFFIDAIIGQTFYRYRGIDMLSIDMTILLLALSVGAMAFVAFIWLQNMITRFKTKAFWRYSEFYYVMRPIKRLISILQENTSLFWKGAIILLGISFVEFMVLILCWWAQEVLLVFFIIWKVIEIPAVIYILLQMQKLQEGGKRISSGDLSNPIDTSRMFWEFKKHGENLNNVSNSIRIAVDEQMKSERFKTELITNVSHDIKTPLTSIINYVDLIKKEEITDETLCEYVDVLDRQSARLKKLIEDLMEASKASTGNLQVNLEECDVEVLLTQIIGEFEEKLTANELEVVVNKPEHPVLIQADGRHMWRVFDNLLNNACKYSLPNTRVYITLTQEKDVVTISFKNISKTALNIPSDELMERFVRGDSSRNTEGSGLGLSIAQSLTELMKGTMKLDIDGDLFKVTLTFSSTNSDKK